MARVVGVGHWSGDATSFRWRGAADTIGARVRWLTGTNSDTDSAPVTCLDRSASSCYADKHTTFYGLWKVDWEQQPRFRSRAEQYGDIRTCRLFGDSWLIIASNKTADGGARWAIGVHRCASTDASCHDGQNDHPLSGWTFYSPPYQEEVTVLTQLDSNDLVLDHGGHQLSFDIATGAIEER